MPDDEAWPARVSGLTRREAVALLASGFALAVQPVAAETTVTDVSDLLVGEARTLPFT